MARKKLGEILIEEGVLDESRLRAALIEQQRWGGPLGRLLVEMRLVEEHAMVGALSRQLHVPTVDLDSIEIPQAVLDLVPGELAEQHSVMPFAQPMKFLDLAMSDPSNLRVLDELRVRTNLNVRSHLAGPKAIERALGRYYGRGMGRAAGAGRRRETLDVGVDDEAMELVNPYDPAASRSVPVAGVNPPSTQSRERIAAPPAPTRTGAASTAPPPAATTRGPSFADVAELQERIASLEALVRRDEDVLKKLMALLIEKGVATRDEILARLR